MAENRLTETEQSLNQISTEMVNITINGISVQVPKGENVIESARRAGVDIPYFCYHPRLSKGDAANCRMCLVEVAQRGPDGSIRKMPKPQTSCTLPAAEGMIIETESESVVKDRRGILEFLLINHPLDCPICDRGGECPLQNNTLFYGPSLTRYIEEKRHYTKAYPLSEHVVFDRERCIHCARCTRFTEDISGDFQLGFLKRGADLEVGTFAQTKFNSLFSGNVIELCPVGALLSRDARFKARPWDLFTKPSVCSKCSNGCNIKLDYRMDTLVRVNARLNEAVNEEWTCDRGKFGHNYISAPDRLKTPYLRRNGKLEPVSWKEAYDEIVDHLIQAGKSAGGIGGGRLTNEDNFLFQKLFRDVIGVSNLDSRIGQYQGGSAIPMLNRLGCHGMGNRIADLERMKTIFVFGSQLEAEQPMLFLRTRKAWRFHSASIISAADRPDRNTNGVGDISSLKMIYKPGTETALLNGIIQQLFEQKLIPADPPCDLAGLKKSVSKWKAEKTSKVTGVAVEMLAGAARLLANGPMAILAGKTVTEHPYYTDISSALGNMLIASGNPLSNLNIPGSECNSQGAIDMGVLPDMGPGYCPVTQPGMNTQQMLEAAAKGELRILWIAGEDLLDHYHDPELVRSALQSCPFVIVNELSMTSTAEQAALVLPAASMAEKDGTYTNCEGRVQKIHEAFSIGRNVKPDWLIFAETAARLTDTPPFFNVSDVMKAIAVEAPIYAGITYKTLGEEGVLRPNPSDTVRNTAIVNVEYQAI